MAHERVLAAFPRRPLQLTKSSAPLFAQVLAFLGFLLFGGLLGGALYEYLPSLLDDTMVGANGVPLPGSWGQWKDCSSYRRLVYMCTLEAHYPAAAPAAGAAAAPAATPDAGKGNSPPPRTPTPAAPPARGAGQQYREMPMMFFGSPENVPITVLRDRTNPDRVATSVGQSYLADRWMSLGVIGGILLALAIACLWGVFHSRSQQRARRELAAQPNPTVVTLTKVQRVKGAATWTFTWTTGARQFKRKDNLVRTKSEPLVLDANGALALALTDQAGRAMLVTAGITNLEVSDAERAAVLDAIQRDLARPMQGVPAVAAAR